MSVTVHDATPCQLGEGPLWHPTRQRLYWFDILGHRLLTQGQVWQFDRPVSAAGWVDDDHLLIASATDLIRFDLRDGSSEPIVALEADNPVTRSNDGRADPQGGFWIGTMGRDAQPEAGALYRFYRGELRQIRDGVTIPNGTCFTPDGRHAYFADTAAQIVWRYTLDADGWPDGAPEIFLDHRGSDVNTDGAIVDAEGRFVCAEWGGSRLACYSPEGNLIEEIALPVPQPTCPAFGRDALYVTSARQGLSEDALRAAPRSGQTFHIATDIKGQAEHQVRL
ncbi:SMP-30/gluconolactonase/LRE family protein [Gymnodinialimonas sp. 2305UL16-5]|uniref:SMP-30/gluconolactonase/LRE family protein n=1 Tax=Gymnodinialimonas mytili TaxID=3126503 RepID=UPI00309959E1